jgi:putative flippase GtrA
MPSNAVWNKALSSQPLRYLINGLAATGIHFLMLTFNLKVLGWSSAGLSNLVAAVFGIAASFLGSRYFVFNNSTESLGAQLYRFILLYVAIALLHGALLYVWVDVYMLSYVIGFVIATFMQVACSYLGNKLMVFKV